MWAMVVAGLEHPVDLAELAMQETGFGVFEDKVLKNYIATEFLFDTWIVGVPVPGQN